MIRVSYPKNAALPTEVTPLSITTEKMLFLYAFQGAAFTSKSYIAPLPLIVRTPLLPRVQVRASPHTPFATVSVDSTFLNQMQFAYSAVNAFARALPSKALTSVPFAVQPSADAKVTLSSAVPTNAFFPIAQTFAGIMIEEREAQPLKAPFPICFRVSGRNTLVTSGRSANTLVPIAVMPFATSTVTMISE